MQPTDGRPAETAAPDQAADAADLLRRIAEESRDLVAAVDPAFRLLSFNRAFGAELEAGYGVEPELGMDVRDAVSPGPEEPSSASVLEAWARALDGEPWSLVAPFGDADRRRRVYEVSARPLTDDGGAVVGASAVMRDVSEREAARAEVERLNARLEDRILERTAQVEQRRVAAELERTRLRAVLDILPVGVWVADAEGRLLETNRAGRTIWGEDVPLSTHREEYGDDFLAWWPDGRRVATDEWGLARALERGEVSIAEEIQIEASDGRRKTILNYALPIRDERDRIVGGVAVNVDITGRKTEERRQELLAAVGEVLSSPLELDARLELLVPVIAERLADVVAVALVEPDGCLGRAKIGAGASELADSAARVEAIARRGELWPATLRSIEGGAPLLIEAVPSDDPGSVLDEPALADMAREVGVRSLLIAPLRGNGGAIGALVLLSLGEGRRYGPVNLEVVSELADRVALGLENVRLFEAAQRAVREREEVVALVSHDLRNPLHTIQMAAAMLEAETLDADKRSMQHSILRRTAERMNRLIDDLLDVTRIGSGTFRIHPAPVNPLDLVEEAVEACAPVAEREGVSLETSLAGDLPVVRADRDRVLQVFSNLIQNGAGFAGGGGTVRVRCERGDAGAVFTISDTGPGIDPSERDSIFDRFWQGSRGATGGAGLGLSIARGIVEAHGGWIRLVPDGDRHPDDGPGATFQFHLPRHS